MFTVSKTATEAVIRDIQTGNTEYVDQFFASRPEWSEEDEETIKQTDKQEEKQA
jgi:hypothetical protein